ncbi:hypothetical protein EC912_101757 [Luteibacter rhizovicinus]|uniref:Virion coat protein B n=1 Tax=Luteibacter rhizovicinus TaxID=242606 RepID=A0A4R3YYK7_9GAMM|nr:hypothetical protein [Luteibacter rhizovicinus]TCV97740.1 hypothetical protein EC912_101757 [Luteibacter rhizovicinus]
MSKNLKELAARNAHRLGKAALIAGAVVSGTAMAAGGTDYSSIGAGVDSSTVVAGLLAMGAILIGPGFAKWATKKVAGFFG